MTPRRSDHPSERPTKGRPYVAVLAGANAHDDGAHLRDVPTEPAPSNLSATIPIIPLRCATLGQFSRLYVGHIRAGKLRLAKDATAERGSVFVRAILPGGVEIDFPGELVDEGGSAVVRFDPVPADVHERVAKIVGGG